MALADALRAQGMTLKALSARTGISGSQLSEYQNGHRLPNPVNAVRVARALGTTPDALDLVRPKRGAKPAAVAAGREG